MNNNGQYDAAFHEAGHAVVAWALGLAVGEIAIRIRGDDTAGNAAIECSAHLPPVDRIAVCLAGLEAQQMFECPIHGLAGVSDYAKIVEIVGDCVSEEERRKLIDAGSVRARELLTAHKAQVRRLATSLSQQGRIDAGSLLSAP